MPAPIIPTKLVITPMSGGTAFILTPYSARGLTQTLEPIVGTGESGGAVGTLFRRTASGKLRNLMPDQFRKYQSTITCRDVQSPSFNRAWLGMSVIVDCVPELSYMTGDTPERDVVEGSVREEGHFTFYRPRIPFMIISINNGLEEYAADYNWKLGMQEL